MLYLFIHIYVIHLNHFFLKSPLSTLYVSGTGSDEVFVPLESALFKHKQNELQRVSIISPSYQGKDSI